MAVTGAIYKTLEFDGESSRSYGVYITGEAVYNAPERDVEMISIAGRNGSYALDKGRFQNIEVTYPAGIFAENEADFRKAISDFRNFLCSKRGYVRLTDEYNPTEYRMAIYKSGLEVTPAMSTAGEFQITFECKPQRWLLSGESPIEATSGDVILNPTLFDASPMLEVEGYGTIGFNGYTIELENETFGNVTLIENASITGTFHFPNTSATFTFPKSTYNAGDTITITGAGCMWDVVADDVVVIPGIDGPRIGDVVITSVSPVVADTVLVQADSPFVNAGEHKYRTTSQPITFTAGTYNTVTQTITASVPIVYWDGSSYATYTTETHTISWAIEYSQHSQTEDAITYRFTGSDDHYSECSYEYYTYYNYYPITTGTVVVASTKSYLGNPTYIDCDLGSAYLIDNGQALSLNKYIDLGSELPVLSRGSNTITFDNTVTDLKIIPRWWKI